MYSTDFTAGVGPEWLTPELEESPNGEKFLGRFANDDGAILSLSGLPAHDRLEVGLDIYIIESMDGNDTGPGSSEEDEGVSHPDVFAFSADGTLLKQTTFGNRHPQAYPGDYPGASNPPKTGAIAEESLGYGEETTFRLSFSFAHSAAGLTFTAAGSGLDDIDDESWGIDNVSVSAEQSAALPTEPIPSGNPGAYERCVKKANGAYRKSLRKAKLFKKKSKRLKGKAKKRRLTKRARLVTKRAKKKRKAQLRRCRATFL